MKVITPMSEKITEALVAGGKITEREIPFYVYCLEYVGEQIVYIASLLALGILFDSLVATVIFIVTFQLFRETAGGAHASTRVRCGILSYGAYSFVMLSYHYLSMPNLWLATGIFFTELVILTVLAPVDTPNKRFTGEQKVKLKRRCGVICLCMSVIFLLFAAISENSYCVVMMFSCGIVVCSQFIGEIQNISRKKKEGH